MQSLAECKRRNGLAPTTATLNANVEKFLTCPEHTPVDPTLLSIFHIVVLEFGLVPRGERFLR